MNDEHLNHTYMGNINLVQASLNDVHLNHAFMGNINLVQANVNDEGLNHTYIGNINLVHANVFDEDHTHTDIGNINLVQANVNDEDHTHTYIENINLVQANVNDEGLNHTYKGNQIDAFNFISKGKLLFFKLLYKYKKLRLFSVYGKILMIKILFLIIKNFGYFTITKVTTNQRLINYSILMHLHNNLYIIP